MRSLRNVVALTGAVIALTCLTDAAGAAQKGTQKDWLRSESKTQPTTSGSGSNTVFAKSLIVLVVLAGGGYFMWRQSRKTKQAAPIKGAHVRVLSGTPIGPKARAVVAEVGGRLILLGVTEHSVRRLAWLDSEPEDVSERVDSRRTEELQDDRRDPLPTQRATTRMASDSSPSILRGSRFSEVLRDAVGLKPKQVVEPAMAIAETTRDRVVLKGKPAKERVNTERSDDYMDIEGQAAGLVARLNRRT